MIEKGIKGHQEQIVTEMLTAAHVGSGLVKVFATPMMVALMESTCASSVENYLENGQGTVGTSVNITHCAATPIGMKVFCDCELIEIDRRRLVFKVIASDECEIIGEGLHERFIVDKNKFQTKIDSKIDR